MLPGFQFADCYAITAPAGVNAIEAYRRIISGTPAWVNALMVVRNCMVGLGGLRTAPISEFPLITESPEQILLGFDDKHLDFRIAVHVAAVTQQLSLTTIVRTHNFFGRAYLWVVLPFHRIIVRRMIERVGRPQRPEH
ncbi:MAG TPA: DUF2867 domain-containing protein [Rhodocyclaceae bacterium]|nr:DUF2867 domain-containing protein [Rhodocyclaceae bacterium]